MIKIENTEIVGLKPAIRGMRNPMNSWQKSDSEFNMMCHCYYSLLDDCDNKECEYCEYNNIPIIDFDIGENDLDLMKRLVKAGAAHAKYKRMINVYCDITSNHTWWAEFDTYEHTVRNSCSKMHKIHVKEFMPDDFSHEGIDEVGGDIKEHFLKTIEKLEWSRNKFNETQEKKYWRAIIDLLPMGYNIKATVMLNYEVLTAIYRWRRNHKMFEWCEFCKWIESLPYSELITGGI